MVVFIIACFTCYFQGQYICIHRCLACVLAGEENEAYNLNGEDNDAYEGRKSSTIKGRGGGVSGIDSVGSATVNIPTLLYQSVQMLNNISRNDKLILEKLVEKSHSFPGFSKYVTNRVIEKYNSEFVEIVMFVNT